jgi:hypothetical protein
MPEDMLDRLFGELAATELPVPAPASVVTRGRKRRRHVRGMAGLAAIAIVALVAVGVSQLAHSSPRTTQVASGRTRPASAVCVAAPSAGLNAELRQELQLSSQSGVSPIAISADGTAVYTETTTGTFRGIAEESLTTGTIIRRIQRLPAGYSGAQGGLGPAGDLVWTSTDSTYGGVGLAGTPVQLWSPRTGTTTTLEPAGQHGGALSAPVIVLQKFAAWEQASGRQQEIVEADLDTGVTVVIARGYLGSPVFVGTALVWPAASRPDGPASHLVARDGWAFPARRPIAVPPALSAAGSAALMGSSSQGTWATPVGLIASNGAIAYFTPDLSELYYSPSVAHPARLVLRLGGGNTFVPGGLAVGPDYLGWTVNGDATYLASAQSLAAARITTFGDVIGAGSDYVFVGHAPVSKSSQQRQFQLFRSATIGALTCAAPSKSASR